MPAKTIIHRRDGKDAVVMSLDSYNSLMENPAPDVVPEERQTPE